MNKPLLTIGYSALAERVKNIVIPNFSSDHNIFISIQNPDGIQYKIPLGQNIESIEERARGVAKSRNAVLNSASTEFLIFGDDDITFHEAGINKALAYFKDNRDCDLILGSAVDETGTLRKRYPRKSLRLNKFNSGKAATYEMMIRVSSFHEKKIYFDENFGAGVDNYLGDEYILISDLLDAGGKAVFLPLVFATHPQDSSGSAWGTAKDLKARSQVFTRIFGIWATPIRAAFIFRRRHGKISLLRKLHFIFDH